jgi:hypothetical protein
VIGVLTTRPVTRATNARDARTRRLIATSPENVRLGSCPHMIVMAALGVNSDI